jgi:hypothetical protein
MADMAGPSRGIRGINLRNAFGISSVILYGVSFCFDAFYIQGPDPRAWAMPFALVTAGWITLIDGVPAWAANPALLVGWLLAIRRNDTGALIASIFAAVLALSFLTCDTILTSEAPDHSKIIGYGPAYWLWVASPIALAIGSCLGLKHGACCSPATAVPARNNLDAPFRST